MPRFAENYRPQCAKNIPDSTIYSTWIWAIVWIPLFPTELNQFDTRRHRGHMDHYDSNSSVSERRSKPRMECAYPATVRGYSLDGKKFEENATVLNLSAGGVYMLINRFINKGQDLSVKIAFPTGSLEWGSSKLATNGVVVRTEALSEEVLGIAIKFQRRRFL